LSGQVAVVTGGGRGLGRIFAHALASAGASVAVIVRLADQVALTVVGIEEAGGRALGWPVDVTGQQAVQRVLSDVGAQLGPVDWGRWTCW
jgi:NAD(P)-dependent dehydrogenase (short-subunit alcohol dehydrogenase family)